MLAERCRGAQRRLAPGGGHRSAARKRILVFFLCFALPAAAPDIFDLAEAARGQVGVTTIYDPAYVRLGFPGGDVDPAHGVCTDVVIRALRTAWQIDLQLAVNREMKADFAPCPRTWGLTCTDRNFDHRRVPNLQTLFARIGAAVEDDDYRPGDLVTSVLPGSLAHIGIVPDARSDDGTRPLVLPNIGAGAQEEDRLYEFPITGHYRLGDEAVARLQGLGR